jgi:hypothetical protein
VFEFGAEKWIPGAASIEDDSVKRLGDVGHRVVMMTSANLRLAPCKARRIGDRSR